MAASQPETTLVGQLHRARLERRTELAQQQIRDARVESTVAELEAQAGDAQLPNGCTCTSQWKSLTWTQNGPTPHAHGCPDAQGGGYWTADAANAATLAFVDGHSGIDPTPPDTLTLSGAKLAAYRQLEVAAAAAHEAQQQATTAGVALREAIQAMCAALAPGAK